MDLCKGGGVRERSRSLSCLLASLQGRPTSEKPQGQRRHLASARVCQAARQAASLLRGGRQAPLSSSVPDQGAVGSAHAPRSSSGQPRVGWGKAQSSLRDCKLTFPHCCCRQNTYTNADKLLEAAEQLAQTGECDPEEIYKAARHLEVRIQDFVRRVEQRKLLLDMSVSFHTHTKEVRARWRRGAGWVDLL